MIELETGRQVCADAVLLTGAAEVNESLLTGESDPVRRSAGEHLLSGSFVVSGRCRARVEHVGKENYAARIAQEAKALRGVRSELLTSMRKVTRLTGYWIPFLGVLLFLEALFLRGDPVQDAVVATSAGLLGMLPKGLVLLTSISLAAGIIALSRSGTSPSPLTTLAEGVRQIRDGNLDHRIAHAQRDEFQPVCEAFNEMADRLRASVEQSQCEEEGRKELLASISHDVRSPLTSIRAYVEGLLDGVADAPEKRPLRRRTRAAGCAPSAGASRRTRISRRTPPISAAS